MPTSARIRKTFDMGRLREALRGPGADTRVWLLTARVDDDPDAIVLDPKLGWIIDVTFYGGALDQEGPVPCRLGMAFAEDGGTRSCPVSANCEVLVAVTDGDANSNPVIVSRMHNAGGCDFPLLVNLTPITEEYAKANHILVTPHGADEQYAGARRVTAPSQLLEAETVAQLAAPNIFLGGTTETPITPAIPPTESFVKGDQYAGAESTFLTALQAWTVAVAGALSTAGFPIVAAQAALEAAIASFKVATADSLSSKIKGE